MPEIFYFLLNQAERICWSLRLLFTESYWSFKCVQPWTLTFALLIVSRERASRSSESNEKNNSIVHWWCHWNSKVLSHFFFSSIRLRGVRELVWNQSNRESKQSVRNYFHYFSSYLIGLQSKSIHRRKNLFPDKYGNTRMNKPILICFILNF